jgi:hypothetical protein
VSDRRLFVGALAALALTFFLCGLRRTNWTTLRGDEILTLTEFERKQSLRDLLAKGAFGQVSPAPLLYVVNWTLDLARENLNYLGLTPQGYYRLPSLLLTAALGFGAALAVGLRLQAATRIQYVFVVCGLAAFYFHPKMFALACTERPYGLWNGLWLFSMAWLLGRPPAPKVPLVALSLLAATATAACFQLLAIGIALVVVRRVEGRPAKGILKEGALLLALPALIGASYALRSVDAGAEELEYAEKAPRFLRFWLLSNLHVWIAAGAMTFLALKRPALRGLAIPSVALLALIVIMPLVFTLGHMKGYPSPSRQYIWTSTAIPLALFFAAIAWPDLKPTRYLRAVAVVASVAIVGGNVHATSRRDLRNDSRELAMLRRDSPLMVMLQKERPRGFLTRLDDIERKNLFLIMDWITQGYRHLPKVDRDVFIFDRNGRLEASVDSLWPNDFEKEVHIHTLPD